MPIGAPVLETGKIERLTFENEIRPLNRPVLMRGQVADWPAVVQAGDSDEAACAYLRRFDNGKPAGTLLGSPEIHGEFFYGDRPGTFNFQRGFVPISLALERILGERDKAEPHAVYVQSVPIADHLPGFADENRLDLLEAAVAPRIWIGNSLRVQTHHDLTDNIACVIAGRRRFTMFPPEQLVNLYVGPFEHTLAGPPVSLVQIEDPDYSRFPRFREAAATAQYAELEAGDALYIPYFWWHHVRSLATFNILVNYWWKDTAPQAGEPYDVLLHALLSIRDMPPAYRDVWRVMFDYYVFGSHGDPAAHLPVEAKGAVGPMSPDLAAAMRRQLLDSLNRQWGGVV